MSLTCDAWQAGNVDGYFVVTAHWIEEPTTGKWELKCALIGFTQLNNVHNGKQLGQALYKVVRQMGIEHKVIEATLSICNVPLYLPSVTKVGHVTCDNASNNTTMIKEFITRLRITMGKKYNWKKRKIKCIHQ